MAVLKEFKEFAVKGNVVDLAVGLIIGAAFGKIVSSLVNDILMPPIGLLMGNVDFANRYFVLRGSVPAGTSVEAAKALPGVVTLNYGLFVNTVIEFLIVAFAVFLLVKQVNRLRRKTSSKEKSAAPDVRACPFCLTDIPKAATRCKACTQALPAT